MTYRRWNLERPEDNQDLNTVDPQPGMAAGRRYKRPADSASGIARAGFQSLDQADRSCPRDGLTRQKDPWADILPSATFDD